MKKRLLALALALGMVCTLLPAASAETAQPAGSGTAADPYRIGTKEELYWFAGQVNGGERSACAVLTADITVNENVLKADGTLADDASGFTPWTPIGSGAAPYIGTFDGRSHTVSGLYLVAETGRHNLGFFGSVDSRGAVKNLTIAGSYFYGGDRVGAVVGHLNNATVESCHNVGSTVYAVSNSGGIVGYASGDTAAICRCFNSGLLRVATGGLYRVGGIVGQVANGAVTYCVNTGTLKCATSGEYVGGIAGDVGGRATVGYCGNTGEIRGYNFVGGLCGSVASGATVTFSWTARVIYCTGDYGNEGEIAGNRSAVVTDCYYVRGAENKTGHGTAKTQTEFEDGTVCTAIDFHAAPDGVCVLCGEKVSAQVADVAYDAAAGTLTAAWSGADGQFLAGCYNEDNAFVKVVTGTRSGNTLTFEDVPSCYQYKVFVLDPTGHAPLGVAGGVRADPYTTGYAEGLSIPTLDAGISTATGIAVREFLRANYLYNDMDAILADPANTREDGALTDEARAQLLDLVSAAQDAWDSVTDSAAVLNAVTKAEIGALEARAASMEEQAELLWWWDSDPDPMEEARKWAQELTDAYDAIDGAKKLQTLAVSLGCDAKTAQKQLNQAQAILQGKYAAEEGAAEETLAILQALKTTGKVAAVVAGGAAVATGAGALGVAGYATAGEAAGLTLAGADAILDIGDQGAKIVGIYKGTPASYEKLQDVVGAANLVLGLFSFKGAENYERLGVISDIKDGGLKKIVELFDFSEKDGKITATVKTSELPEGMTPEEVKAFQKALEDAQKDPAQPEKTDKEKEQELKTDLEEKKPDDERLKEVLEEATGQDDLQEAKDDLENDRVNEERKDEYEKDKKPGGDPGSGDNPGEGSDPGDSGDPGSGEGGGTGEGGGGSGSGTGDPGSGDNPGSGEGGGTSGGTTGGGDPTGGDPGDPGHDDPGDDGYVPVIVRHRVTDAVDAYYFCEDPQEDARMLAMADEDWDYCIEYGFDRSYQKCHFTLVNRLLHYTTDGSGNRYLRNRVNYESTGIPTLWQFYFKSNFDNEPPYLQHQINFSQMDADGILYGVQYRFDSAAGKHDKILDISDVCLDPDMAPWSLVAASLGQNCGTTRVYDPDHDYRLKSLWHYRIDIQDDGTLISLPTGTGKTYFTDPNSPALGKLEYESTYDNKGRQISAKTYAVGVAQKHYDDRRYENGEEVWTRVHVMPTSFYYCKEIREYRYANDEDLRGTRTIKTWTPEVWLNAAQDGIDVRYRVNLWVEETNEDTTWQESGPSYPSVWPCPQCGGG